MIIDCHVHIAATRPEHGRMSPQLINSFAFRFMRWRMGLDPNAATFDDDVEAFLVRALHETPKLDAAVLLAFDAWRQPWSRLSVAPPDCDPRCKRR